MAILALWPSEGTGVCLQGAMVTTRSDLGLVPSSGLGRYIFWPWVPQENGRGKKSLELSEGGAVSEEAGS